MRFFKKSLPDDEWIEQMLPIYQDVEKLGSEFAEAMSQVALDNDLATLLKVMGQLNSRSLTVSDSVKNAPSPSSRPARTAERHVKSALDEFMDWRQISDINYRISLAHEYGPRDWFTFAGHLMP